MALSQGSYPEFTPRENQPNGRFQRGALTILQAGVRMFSGPPWCQFSYSEELRDSGHPLVERQATRSIALTVAFADPEEAVLMSGACAA